MRPAALVFAVASLAQWLVPLVGVWQHERIIARGVAVRFECGAPDPYDPFRGRFLTVRPSLLSGSCIWNAWLSWRLHKRTALEGMGRCGGVCGG